MNADERSDDRGTRLPFTAGGEEKSESTTKRGIVQRRGGTGVVPFGGLSVPQQGLLLHSDSPRSLWVTIIVVVEGVRV